MISKEQVGKLLYSDFGNTYCNIGSGATTPDKLIYSVYGNTWWGHSGTPTYIKFIGVSWENVGKAIGVSSDSVKKLMGVEP